MSVLPHLLAANQRFARGYASPTAKAPPRRRVAILTCMDARLMPERFLGLDEGDAHVIRNAGGRASSDALRSLILSSRVLGTREFLVIHHTDCGLEGLDEEAFRRELGQDSGADASNQELLGFADLETSVREDVETIRASPYLPAGVSVRGLVYEVETGRLVPVES